MAHRSGAEARKYVPQAREGPAERLREEDAVKNLRAIFEEEPVELWRHEHYVVLGGAQAQEHSQAQPHSARGCTAECG